MTGAECLLRTLTAAGVNICFTNPGTSEMQFVAALDRVPAMRAVLCLFEGVCSGAADGYARMTGQPACTLLHLGPGLANALANFHNARKARSPIVSVVGEHSTQHLKYDAPLSADIPAFAQSVSEEIRCIGSAEEIGRVAAEAIAAARRPPGAISHLIVPADCSWNQAGEVGTALPVTPPAGADSATVRACGRLIREGATTTGILLGGTTLQSRGLAAAARLSAAGVRVFADRNAARTESGRGRFQPKRIPYFPEPAYEALAGLKNLITVEAKPPVSFFGYPGLRSELLPEGCQVHTLAAVDGDGTAALEELADDVRAPAWKPSPTETSHGSEGDGRLTPDVVGRVLARLLPEDAIISDEMISAGEPVWRQLLHAAPHTFMPITGGSIGQGLPLAVGAAIACPDRKVFSLEADGSAMYTLQSLWTAARENLDITTIVFANQRYRILDVEMKRTGVASFGPAAERMIDIGNPELDFVRMSEGMGVEAVRVTTACELATQLEACMRERRPRLIEAMIEG